MKQKTTKNLLLPALILGLLLFSSCGQTSQKAPTTEPSKEAQTQDVSQEKTQPKQQVYSVNQEVKVGKSIWKLVLVKDKGSILKASESYEPRAPYYRTPYDKITDGKFIEIFLETEICFYF